MSDAVLLFAELESEVRSYCRSYPVIFERAKDSYLYDSEGTEYIDFLCAAGAMSYGHNNEAIKAVVLDYMNEDGILMSLDLHSKAKKEFISTFREKILRPRDLEYKLQFTSPTGTSVVESAVKLARKYTGRHNVAAFTNGFHGMSGTSLSLTGSKHHRQAVPSVGVTRLPYDGYLGQDFDTIAYCRKLFEDQSSGVDLPAAIVVETIQAEGGVNVSSATWLQNLRELCTEFGVLLIVDDIQAGCGRSGGFFSFERAGIKPDMVCLSKSIGGIGFPLAVLLLSPDLDVWSPGEDNGTFRGNNLAFLAASTMLEKYWSDQALEKEIAAKEDLLREYCERAKTRYSTRVKDIRGLGLIQGIEFYSQEDAEATVKSCFEGRLVIETCGPRGQVIKLLPPLTTNMDVIIDALRILDAAIEKHATVDDTEIVELAVS